jgi:hypothetical protein
MAQIPEQRSAPGASERARRRRLRATFIDKRGLEPPVADDKGRPRFPIADRAQARSALSRLSQTEGLTSEQKQVVAQRAANVLGEVSPGARKYGVTRLTRSRREAVMRRPTVLRPKTRSAFGRPRRGFGKKRRAGFKRGR